MSTHEVGAAEAEAKPEPEPEPEPAQGWEAGAEAVAESVFVPEWWLWLKWWQIHEPERYWGAGVEVCAPVAAVIAGAAGAASRNAFWSHTAADEAEPAAPAPAPAPAPAGAGELEEP